jgi:hypothetical protein
MPKWREGREHYLPRNLLSSGVEGVRRWRCAVGHDAHRDTDAQFGRTTVSRHLDGSSGGLTGEPFGRQIWTTSSPRPSTGGGDTEDDLNAILTKEFPITSTMSKLRDDDSDEKVPTGEGTGGASKPSDGIGNFLQNLLKPDRQAQQPKDELKSERAKGVDWNELIDVLSSGGRRPLAFDPSANPNSCDQLFRAQMISSYLDRSDGALPDDISYLLSNKSEGGRGDEVDNRPKSAMEAARRGIAFYSMLQTADGHFAGDYGGPHFLLPGLVVAWYVMGRPSVMISDSQRDLMLHYLMVHQQEDGGWVSERV